MAVKAWQLMFAVWAFVFIARVWCRMLTYVWRKEITCVPHARLAMCLTAKWGCGRVSLCNQESDRLKCLQQISTARGCFGNFAA